MKNAGHGASPAVCVGQRQRGDAVGGRQCRGRIHRLLQHEGAVDRGNSRKRSVATVRVDSHRLRCQFVHLTQFLMRRGGFCCGVCRLGGRSSGGGWTAVRRARQCHD